MHALRNLRGISSIVLYECQIFAFLHSQYNIQQSRGKSQKESRFFLYRHQARSSQISRSRLTGTRQSTAEIDSNSRNLLDSGATEARFQRRELQEHDCQLHGLDSTERELGSISMKLAGNQLEWLARVQRAASLSQRARFVSCARTGRVAESRGVVVCCSESLRVCALAARERRALIFRALKLWRAALARNCRDCVRDCRDLTRERSDLTGAKSSRISQYIESHASQSRRHIISELDFFI